ncbi:MAG: alpha/beta fold hydrolase [Acidimicrobiia bacterium]
MSEYISVFTTTAGEADVMRSYQRVLDAWPVAHQELWVDTSFGRTFVIASGPEDGEPVVLLHALFATAMSWYRNVEDLSKSHRTYCIDVIGEGNRSRPLRPITSLDEFLEWFTQVLDGLGVETAALIGNSYGGFTAAYYAMNLPERIRKLVLIGPAATVHSMRPFMVHMFIPKGLYLLLRWLPGVRWAMRRSVEWMHDGLPPDPLWEPLFLDTMVHGMLLNRVFPRVYTRAELDRIEAPTLLILGEQDRIYGELAPVIESAGELIPDVRISVIPRAHHITGLSQPDLVNRELLGFLTAEPAATIESSNN